MNRRIPLAPAEGWLPLGLVMLLCLTMAWAIDDVALVLGNGTFTDFLAPMALAGVLIGFIGAKVGWGRWLTYLIGAIFAALIVPLVVGYQLQVKGPAVLDAYTATAASLVRAVIDLTIDGQTVTDEYGHYMLFLGLLVWGTSMFAAYATFGQRRPLNAIVIVGLVLLINMSLTYNDQLRYLVLFTIAALVLLVRYHVLDEQTEWLRRRIGDPASISSIYLRGGTVFIGVAVVGSVLLTNVATVGAARGDVVRLQQQLRRAVPVDPAVPADGWQHQADRQRLRPELHEHPRQVAAEPGARRHRQAPGHRQDRLLLARGDLRPVHPERLEGQWPAGEGAVGAERPAARRYGRGRRPRGHDEDRVHGDAGARRRLDPPLAGHPDVRRRADHPDPGRDRRRSSGPSSAAKAGRTPSRRRSASPAPSPSS